MDQALYLAIERFNQTNMKPSRIEHTRRVMEMAILLAERYDYDYKIAKLAAILHDVAKHFNRQQVHEALKQNGLSDPYLWKVPYLAHGEIGAAVAKSEFGIQNEDVLNAIRYHTYGRRGMSKLEKIIFIADYIEEGRDFEGVDIARKLAFESLDQCMFFAASHSISFLMKTGSVIHPNAIEVYNEWHELQKEIVT
jgi:predicted HD superfamily hydrolase involved in NAD metabolism